MIAELLIALFRSSRSFAMLLEKWIVACDLDVFRYDGSIVIPRSDGDASRQPSLEQLQRPNLEDEIFEYRRICSADEPYVKDFLQKAGRMLAVDVFGFADDRDWRLAALPENYTFTVNMRKPYNDEHPDKVHVRVYIYGPEKPLHSSQDFIAHLTWLMLDTELDKSNCLCRFCCDFDGYCDTLLADSSWHGINA